MRARACAAVYPPPASCVTFVGLAAGLQLLGAEEEGRRMGRGGRLLPGRAAGRVRLAEELGGLRGDVVNTGDARTLSTSVVTDSCPSGAGAVSLHEGRLTPQRTRPRGFWVTVQQKGRDPNFHLLPHKAS